MLGAQREGSKTHVHLSQTHIDLPDEWELGGDAVLSLGLDDQVEPGYLRSSKMLC